ncbi:Rieske 2Fe-2S domain-containing protein [Nocardia niigatensis]
MTPVSVPARRARTGQHPYSAPPSFPHGWFVVAFSEELRPGKLLTCRLAGRDIVVARTRSGQVTASEAYCPHLGAHLKGGTVTALGVRCPFHGFEFDAQGACVATPYDGPPPRAARLTMLAVREMLGTIMVWHGPHASEPEWEVTAVDADPDKWLLPRHKVVRFTGGSAQECTENSVDLGHLRVLHGFGAVTVRRPLETDGPYLRTAYSARLGRVPVLGSLDVEFDVYVDGLGFSRVETSLPRLGWTVRQLVLATETDRGAVELRLAVSVQRRTGRPRWLWTAIAHLVQTAVMARFAAEVAADKAIWMHKAYLDRPALAAGDGPIGPYRRWSRQFYSQQDTPTPVN